MSKKAHLSLGSNIGDRLDYLTKATQRLNEHPDINVEKISSVYETAAWGLENQDDFYNIVLVIKTDLAPFDLLSTCQKIEIDLERTREIHWGPRTIDIDILLYENVEMNTEALTIPHKYLLERAFVTIPLAEIEPGIKVNGIEVSKLNLTHQCRKTDKMVDIMR